MARQRGLFDAEAAPTGAPDGFAYQPDLIPADEEGALIERIRTLPFAPFEFHGYTGRRRVVSFGWRYDFSREEADEAPPLPDFLAHLRVAAARLASLPPEWLAQALVTEYEAGAAIGWHRDKAVFGEVVGISLLGRCRLRFRCRHGARWQRFAQDLAPRSGYRLTGPARLDWEHSIPTVESLRYSVTFRTLRRTDP